MFGVPHYGNVDIYKFFIDKLVTEHNKDDKKVKVKILPEHVMLLDDGAKVIRNLVEGVAHLSKVRFQPCDFDYPIKSLNCPIEAGEIYCLTTRWGFTECHVIASILFKDFSGKIHYIFNDSHGEDSMIPNILNNFHEEDSVTPQSKMLYSALEEGYIKKELKVKVVNLCTKTQFNTQDCPIISIATMAILSKKVAKALLAQKPGEDLNLDIDGFKDILKGSFKESTTGCKSDKEKIENKNNRDTLFKRLKFNDSVLDQKLKAILFQDKDAYALALEREAKEKLEQEAQDNKISDNISHIEAYGLEALQDNESEVTGNVEI